MTMLQDSAHARPGPSEAMLREYYERRAGDPSSDAKAERQLDLARLRRAVADEFANRTVLDVACGTGYWTACFADRARHVVGIDTNPAVLDVARAKTLARTRFTLGDPLVLADQLGRFDAAFAGFWWSHIPRRSLSSFVTRLHRRLAPGARVVILDNLFVAGTSAPLVFEDKLGDSWQEHVLLDGSRQRVLKNFPRYEELMELFEDSASQTHWWQLDYYWWFEYVLR